jgi:hypothetical protein
MNKAKTAKILSAAAVANMAAVGLAATPAMAAVGLAAAPAGASARPADWAMVRPSAAQLRQAVAATKAAAAKAAPAAARPRGFVPRRSPNLEPATETGCNDYICVGLYGGGSYVSYVNAHWYNGPGCTAGYIFSVVSGVIGDTYYYPDVCYKQQISHTYSGYYYPGTLFCADFTAVDNGQEFCEEVRLGSRRMTAGA